MSERHSDRKRANELKVLELHDKGFSYRKIAMEVHVSLRDVAKYIQRISNRKESQSRTSIHDEIFLNIESTY
jgi:DNA-binding NarL/FixJ family response regulator